MSRGGGVDLWCSPENSLSEVLIKPMFSTLLKSWRPQRESNPCLHRERVMSWAARRWGPRDRGFDLASGRRKSNDHSAGCPGGRALPSRAGFAIGKRPSGGRGRRREFSHTCPRGGTTMGQITRQAPGRRFCQVVVHGDTVYIAGQVAPKTVPSVKSQTQQILKEIDKLLKSAGTNKSKLLMANVWLSDIRTFDEMNEAWDAWVAKDNMPARATVEAKLAGTQFLVEIAVIAAR